MVRAGDNAGVNLRPWRHFGSFSDNGVDGSCRNAVTFLSFQVYCVSFHGFPFLFRGMPVHGIGWIFLALITFGISNLVICFLINKQTAVHYLENGYKPVGPNWDVAASSNPAIKIIDDHMMNIATSADFVISFWG